MISRLGLGTVKFGRTEGLRYAPFNLPSLDQLRQFLGEAERLGINFLDTAAAYGTSERRIGELIKGHRDRWVISTKAGEIFKNGKSSYNFDPEFIEKSLHHSLSQLKTDYVDIFLIHCDQNDDAVLGDERLVEKLNSFKTRGLARAIGASTNTIEGGLHATEIFDCIMVAYSSAYREHHKVIEQAKRNGKGVLIKKPLNCGVFDNANASLRLCQSSKADSIIVGSIKVDHLKANAAAFA